MDTGLEFGILGPLEVRRGGTLVPVGGPRQRALLAVLLCHANRVVSRDQRVDELLGDQPAGSSERMLRVQISRLPMALTGGGGPPRVLARPPGYLLRVESGELDLEVFEQRAAAGRHMLEQSDPGQAAVLLAEAESLWRGRPLADPVRDPAAPRAAATGGRGPDRSRARTRTSCSYLPGAGALGGRASRCSSGSAGG